MNTATLPIHTPIVKITNFDGWKDKYDSYHYANALERLVGLAHEKQSDPIAYIINLSKDIHLSDAIIAEILGITWTAKMVFTLRKQCGIIGNDHRQANTARLAARPKQSAPIQQIVGSYIEKIRKLTIVYPNREYSLEELLQKIDFHSVDDFFNKMSQESLGERPIKQIIDALYEKHDVSPGKGSRVGLQYIRTKLATCKALVTS